MEIRFTDLDIVDINVKVAEQSIIKASIENDTERKIKDLIFARNSIDNALASFGMNVQELKIMQNPPSRQKMGCKSKSVVKPTDY